MCGRARTRVEGAQGALGCAGSHSPHVAVVGRKNSYSLLTQSVPLLICCAQPCTRIGSDSRRVCSAPQTIDVMKAAIGASDTLRSWARIPANTYAANVKESTEAKRLITADEGLEWRSGTVQGATETRGPARELGGSGRSVQDAVLGTARVKLASVLDHGRHRNQADERG